MTHKTAIWFYLLMLLIASGLAIYILFGASFFVKFANVGGNSPDLLLDETVLEQVGVVQDSRLNEISGIVTSIRYPDAFWVHNDSGNPAEVFLISISGQTLARVTLSGARNIDWEDICAFKILKSSYVCVGDVGDNMGKRGKYQLYIFEEPELDLDFGPQPQSQSSDPIEIEIGDFKKIEFEYEDGPKNCEAIAFDRNKRSMFLVEKRRDRADSRKTLGIYQLQLTNRLDVRNPAVAKKISETSFQSVTAMDISPDTKRILIANYVTARLIIRPIATRWSSALLSENYQQLPLPVQRQGEAICFSTDGNSAFVVSELAKQPIWKINIDAMLAAINKPKK